MIRANVMPRRREALRIFGLHLDRDLARWTLVGALWAGSAAAATAALESVRVAQLQRELDIAGAAVSAHAGVRTTVRALALDIARYQEFAREATLARRSGPAVARAIVRIGNALPARVWLDAYVSSAEHVDLNGTSQSVAALGNALEALDRALPGNAATLITLEHRADMPDAVRFTARIGRSAVTGKAAGL